MVNLRWLHERKYAAQGRAIGQIAVVQVKPLIVERGVAAEMLDS
jgi:hypothetical protein